MWIDNNCINSTSSGYTLLWNNTQLTCHVLFFFGFFSPLQGLIRERNIIANGTAGMVIKEGITPDQTVY